MSKKYTSKELRLLLEHVIYNAVRHMYYIEVEVQKIKLKMDGTDDPEILKKAQLYTLLLTILNDTIHPAHTFAQCVVEANTIERYAKSQDLAAKNNLVDSCNCFECQKRGRDDVVSKMDVAGNSSDSKEREKTTQDNKPENSDSLQADA